MPGYYNPSFVAKGYQHSYGVVGAPDIFGDLPNGVQNETLPGTHIGSGNDGTFVLDLAGEQVVLQGLAAGIDDWLAATVDVIKTLAPFDGGVHRRKRGEPPRIGHYANSIDHMTYLGGNFYDGTPVKVGGFVENGGKDVLIKGAIFSTSTLAHLLELTGAKPHDIPMSQWRSVGSVVSDDYVIKHPGFQRKPHFTPGLLSSTAAVAQHMAGKIP